MEIPDDEVAISTTSDIDDDYNTTDAAEVGNGVKFKRITGVSWIIFCFGWQRICCYYQRSRWW